MSTAVEATVYQRLREHLSYIELTAAAENLGAELDRAQSEKANACSTSRSRPPAHAGSAAGCALPLIHKTLADFAFDFQPSVDRAVMAELSALRFVEEKRNVLLLGPPGATALGIAATESGNRTYFVSAADLVANLQAAHLEGTAASKMRTYTGSVLVIDELGYPPLDQTSANWIFQVLSRRYERGSIVLTSNRRLRRLEHCVR